MHRFFAPDLDPGDEAVSLPREEAEHLRRVLRLGVGDTVAVFDGRGREFLARIVDVERRDARVQILSRREAAPEPPVAITLGQAVLKGDKMDEVVRDGVMLGAAAVQPIVTARAETTVAALDRGHRVDRWRRVALASAKQSGRAVLPEIRRPLTLASVLDDPLPALTIMLVEPSAAADGDPSTPGIEPVGALRRESAPADALVMVGPEGGWSAEELRTARDHGARLMTLGCRTLRADAVAIAALSVLLFLWEP